MLRLIVELPKPVMAQIAGPVRAGGMGIVGACDLVVAAESANFAFTEARIGVAPAMISLTTLDTMGQRQAARYWLTGETFGAAAAARLGLITVACGDAEIDEVTGNLAAQILATSPQGSAETKQLLTAARRQRLAADGADMAALSARLFASDEAQEGIHAFLERREPAWRVRTVSPGHHGPFGSFLFSVLIYLAERTRSSATAVAGTVTSRERRYSPRPLACGSGRVVADTPGASRPCTTKLRARRFGSS